MDQIKLFGASTTTGSYIKKHYKKYFTNVKLESFSRSNKGYISIDLEDNKYPKELYIKKGALFVSLAPIWLFVPFLKKYLSKVNSHRIKGIIVVSSTSTITKKYSWNKFDKELYSKLSFWENELIKLKKIYKLKITLIRPSLVYGDIGYKEDKNLSHIFNLMQKLLIFPIPRETGIRQPIHYSQLAKCIIKISKSYLKNSSKESKILNILNLGGDQELSFEKILLNIKINCPKKTKIRTLFFLKIPNRLFFLFCIPIILVSPKYYAAILRLATNMGGFKPAYKFLGENKRNFPIRIK